MCWNRETRNSVSRFTSNTPNSAAPRRASTAAIRSRCVTGRQGADAAASGLILRQRYDVRPAVLLPARLVMLLAGRAFLAVAHDRKLPGGNSHADQVLLGGFGPLVAQRHVVLSGATLVAVALDGQLIVRIQLQNIAQFRRIR